LFYLNVELAIPLCKKIPYIRRFVRHFEVLNRYTAPTLLTVLFISASRYFVYSLQYYLLLLFFGIEVPFLLGMASIALIFFVQTSVPLPPVYGLAVRGNVALRVWAFFTANTLGILSSTFGLWLINVLVLQAINNADYNVLHTYKMNRHSEFYFRMTVWFEIVSGNFVR